MSRKHTFTGDGYMVRGADNCQICGRWSHEPETEDCKNYKRPINDDCVYDPVTGAPRLFTREEVLNIGNSKGGKK